MPWLHWNVLNRSSIHRQAPFPPGRGFRIRRGRERTEWAIDPGSCGRLSRRITNYGDKTRQKLSPKCEYKQMFRLKFARVVEHADQVLEVEYRGQLTSAQKRSVDEMWNKGWTIRFIERGASA